MASRWLNGGREPSQRGRIQGPIAVTGLTGFIGNRLAAKLLALQVPTRAIVRSTRRLRAGLEPWRVALDDADGLGEALQGVTAVVHLAGAVRGRNYEDFQSVNVDAVANLCAAIDQQSPPPPPLLLVSSFAAQRPELSDYAASKRSGEAVLEAWPHLDHTIVRPPAIYGPGDREMRPLLEWMRRGLTIVPGNPHQRLAFLHVDDLIGAFVAWLRDPARCRHGRFEIDDGAPHGYDWPAIVAAVDAPRNQTVVVPAGLLRRVSQANRALAGVMGYAPMLTPGKVRELTQDSWQGGDGTFGVLTGWQPRYDLATGLQQLFGGD